MRLHTQRIIFWVLAALIVAAAVTLFAHREQRRTRIERLAEDTPLDAPYTDAEPVTLLLANDNDGTITATTRKIALPAETTARARALLDHLITEYALPGSAHPLQPGAAINEVFLLPLPVVGHSVDPNATPDASGRTPTVPVAPAPDALQPQTPGGQLAVIDLRGSFVNQHPSGVEVETLTIESMIGTLHANLPQIEQIRFLVDGQSRETLAGHADLLRTYPSRDTSTGNQ
ncbi:MAG TPA: GerMN domain-containing protein [Candidatus Aquilonibacter sp.]|nr:GerMN domain-containing protein [Candidatus Aquilonibacter sp.]